jgi:hypothetical protein
VNDLSINDNTAAHTRTHRYANDDLPALSRTPESLGKRKTLRIIRHEDGKTKFLREDIPQGKPFTSRNIRRVLNDALWLAHQSRNPKPHGARVC